MKEAAKNLDFERAMELRDILFEYKSEEQSKLSYLLFFLVLIRRYITKSKIVNMKLIKFIKQVIEK